MASPGDIRLPSESTSGRRPWILLALVALVFLASRAWLLSAHAFAPNQAWVFLPDGSDMPLYGELGRQGVDCEGVAYRDFECQYPPVAWWLMMVPRLLDSQTFATPHPTPAQLRHYFGWNTAWYHGIFFSCDAVCLVLMILIGRRYPPPAGWALPAAYTLITLAQPHLLFERLDIGLAMFLLLWVYSSIRSQDNRPGADLWACASFLFLGLGISYKIVPLVCVPFLLLAEIWAGRGIGRFLLVVWSLAIGGLGPFVLQMRSSGWTVLDLFQYHSEREINLESTWASLVLVLRHWGLPADVVFSHGGYNLTGPWRGTVKTACTASLFAATAVLGLWALWRGRWFDRRVARDVSLLAMINSMVLSHIFSPQYLVWALPIALLLALDTFPRRWSVWLALAVLMATILAISSWIFPNHHIPLRSLEPPVTNLAIARSACLVALALLLSVAFFARYGLLHPRVESAATASADGPAQPAMMSEAAAISLSIWLLFLASRLWLLIGFQPILSDIDFYREQARRGLDGEHVVYRDFRFDYPPLAWWAIAAPRLVDPNADSVDLDPLEPHPPFTGRYATEFRLEMLLADLASFALACAIGARVTPRLKWLLPAVYGLTSIAQPDLLLDRLDVGLVMFFFLWIYCILRSLEPAAAADRWALAGYLVLGLAISFKAVPVVCAPFVLLADWWTAPSAWRWGKLASCLAAGALGPFLIQTWTSGWDILFPFRFHAGRLIHLESAWSSLVLLARPLGVPFEVLKSNGGFYLSGPWQPALKIVASVSLFAAVALLGLWALGRGRTFDRRTALDTALLAVINSVVVAFVYSPQYLIWLVPLTLLLAIDVFPRRPAPWCGLGVLVTLIVGISSWIVRDYERLILLETLPVALSILRSGCLLGLGLLLNVAFFRKFGLLPSSFQQAVVAVPTAESN